MAGRRNELRVKPKVYNQRCLVLLQCLHPMMHWSEMEPRRCAQLGWEMADRWVGESGTVTEELDGYLGQETMGSHQRGLCRRKTI